MYLGHRAGIPGASFSTVWTNEDAWESAPGADAVQGIGFIVLESTKISEGVASVVPVAGLSLA